MGAPTPPREPGGGHRDGPGRRPRASSRLGPRLPRLEQPGRRREPRCRAADDRAALHRARRHRGDGDHRHRAERPPGGPVRAEPRRERRGPGGALDRRGAGPDAGRRRVPRVVADAVERRPPQVRRAPSPSASRTRCRRPARARRTPTSSSSSAGGRSSPVWAPVSVPSSWAVSCTGSPPTRGVCREPGCVVRRPGSSWSRRACALAVAIVDLVRFGSGAFTTSYVVRWSLREARPAGCRVGPRQASRQASRAGRRGDHRHASARGAGLLTVSIGHFGLRGGRDVGHHLDGAPPRRPPVGRVGGWARTPRCWGSARLGLSRGARSARVLGGFHVPATISVVVIAVSGIYLASDVVVSVDAALLDDVRPGPARSRSRSRGLVGLVALGDDPSPAHSAGAGAGGSGRPLVGPGGRRPARRRRPAGLLATGQPAVSPRPRHRGGAERLDDRPVADLQQTLALRPNRPGASVALHRRPRHAASRPPVPSPACP